VSESPPTTDDVDRWWQGVLTGEISPDAAADFAELWLGLVPPLVHDGLYSLLELRRHVGNDEEVRANAARQYAWWRAACEDYETDPVGHNREQFRSLLRRMLTSRPVASVRPIAQLLLANKEYPDATQQDVDDVLRPRHKGPMTEDEVMNAARALPGVVAVTASEASGAPPLAWGDTFVFYDPDDDAGNRLHPFATIVTKDYPGFDEVSRLDRDGTFRLNIAVGRERYAQLLGHAAPDHGALADRFDYAATDTVLPHPVYATQGWVSIVNPGERSGALALQLLAGAAELARARYERRATS